MEAVQKSPAAETSGPGTVTLAMAVESPGQMQDLGRRIAGVLAPVTW
ncbi:hypothetical protein Sfulv_36680 [Streptomyces fulvorobeus]|uniref:Uncharacterized protein n=1 Tax=Streptomyces fulvorobeus TaxID=284028 RepID=A0A7J0C9K5_9ACTN|nr:hypothetical protein Sfulv_36680 [Streptomyces fulvorobeus]